MPWIYKKLHICKYKGHENFEAMRFCFGHVVRRLPEEWPEAYGSLAVVGAGTMHGFGTYPIRNPTIWLMESRNQVN